MGPTEIQATIDYANALDALEDLVSKRELLEVLWMALRARDLNDGRPMALTLAELVDRLNAARELQHKRPLRVDGYTWHPGAEYLALACTAAMDLAEERRRACPTATKRS